MASYGIQVQMYIDDKPTSRVFNHSTTSSTVSALYPNVDKPDGPVIETKMLIDNEWTTVGYVRAATGIDASGNTTHGAVLKSVDGNSYVIATNACVYAAEQHGALDRRQRDFLPHWRRLGNTAGLRSVQLRW